MFLLLLFPACSCASLVCVRVFCMTERTEVHLWMLKLASVSYVGPQICAFIYSLFTSILPPFFTLSLYVSRGIICLWVFTADVLNTDPTVAFIWENIFLQKSKHPSVSDHSHATAGDRRQTSMSVWALKTGGLIPPQQNIREVGCRENHEDSVNQWRMHVCQSCLHHLTPSCATWPWLQYLTTWHELFNISVGWLVSMRKLLI